MAVEPPLLQPYAVKDREGIMVRKGSRPRIVTEDVTLIQCSDALLQSVGVLKLGHGRIFEPMLFLQYLGGDDVHACTVGENRSSVG